MNIAKQLFQLQEIDLKYDSEEHTLNLITSQLGESAAVVRAEQQLDSERQRLEELTGQQHSIEWDIDDVSGKLKKVDEELYSGKTSNPKELTDLQHESELLKGNRSRLEEQALEIMEKVEQATKDVAASEGELKKLKDQWQNQQKKLSSDMAKLKSSIKNLSEKRQRLIKDIDPDVIEIYQELRKLRGTAVAKVEQGTCRGCRISLPVSELQRVRGSGMVRCSSCGRILFLD